MKNFQLIDSLPEDKYQREKYYREGGDIQDEDPDGGPVPPIIVQLGKVGKERFNMDYQYPLSMFQAFAICLARFDCKKGPKPR
jgi:hypothetical protein